MLKENNNPCRLISSLLSYTFFLTVLAASNARRGLALRFSALWGRSQWNKCCSGASEHSATNH